MAKHFLLRVAQILHCAKNGRPTMYDYTSTCDR
jgi:hypothetical protein